MSAAKTPWFPVSVKPVHVGVYELRGPHGPLVFPFHYWDGKDWLHLADFHPKFITKARIKNAGPMGKHVAYITKSKWRGLAERAK